MLVRTLTLRQGQDQDRRGTGGESTLSTAPGARASSPLTASPVSLLPQPAKAMTPTTAVALAALAGAAAAGGSVQAALGPAEGATITAFGDLGRERVVPATGVVGTAAAAAAMSAVAAADCGGVLGVDEPGAASAASNAGGGAATTATPEALPWVAGGRGQ